MILMSLAALVFVGHNAAGKVRLSIEGSGAAMPIAVPDFRVASGQSAAGTELAEILRRDLYLTGLFDIIPGRPSGPSPEAPDFERWLQTGAQAIVLGVFQDSGGRGVLEGRMYDTATRGLILGKRFSGSPDAQRLMVHTLGDRILAKLTGVPGCFTSRIAFVGLGKSREVYSMDFDGHNLRRVSATNSINMSPEWSPDGSVLIFTSYVRGKPDLWALNLKTGKRRLVSGRAGINASGRYSPDGGRIALSTNYKGIPKIFVITTQGNIIKRLTDGRGNDISPTWSPDGASIAYVSDHTGSPQIYVMSVDGGRAERLTFETNYNTDPDWSPRGDRIAFTARVEGRFQICAMRTDRTDFRVLTSQGTNEDPAWSPDGRMIAFSSNRDGSKRIYVMDAWGRVQVPVSPIPGKSPAWR